MPVTAQGSRCDMPPPAGVPGVVLPGAPAGRAVPSVGVPQRWQNFAVARSAAPQLVQNGVGVIASKANRAKGGPDFIRTAMRGRNGATGGATSILRSR